MAGAAPQRDRAATAPTAAPPPRPLRTHRLFLALWPEPPQRDALARWAGRWRWPASARRVPPERLHLTLHFLGEVPADQLPALTRALARPLQPFVLGAGAAARWPQGVALWRPLQVPAALPALQASLGEALASQGRRPESRPWRAHITLARQAAAAVPPGEGLDLRWTVRGYALVESVLGPGGGYRVLARY